MTEKRERVKNPNPEFVGYTTVEIESIRQQVMKGQTAKHQVVIICPYCMATNIEDKAFCCEQLRTALQLIFESPCPTS